MKGSLLIAVIGMLLCAARSEGQEERLLQQKTLRFITNNLGSLKEVHAVKHFLKNKNRNIVYTLEASAKENSALTALLLSHNSIDSAIVVEDTVIRSVKLLPYSRVPFKKQYDLIVAVYDTIIDSPSKSCFVTAEITSYGNYDICHLACRFDFAGNLLAFEAKECTLKITAIKTDDDAIRFIHERAYPEFTLLSPASDSSSSGREMQMWRRFKWDKDGNECLMAFGNMSGTSYVCIAADNGKDYRLFLIGSDSLLYSTLPEVIKIRGVSVPVCNGVSIASDAPQQHADSLVFKYGGLMELNTKPVCHHIEKIAFAASGTYAGCPVFELIIHDNGEASYFPHEGNPRITASSQDKLSCTISNTNYQRLINVLNYIDFGRCNDEYKGHEHDHPVYSLILTYDGGKKLQVLDSSGEGTYALMSLYDKLLELRYTEDWK